MAWITQLAHAFVSRPFTDADKGENLKLRTAIWTGLAVLLVPLAASATPVDIPIAFNTGDSGYAFQLTLVPTTGTIFSFTLPTTTDTELFLFSSTWLPLWSEDDALGPPPTPNASLTYNTVAGDTAVPGVYHLVVTIFNTTPADAVTNQPIFPENQFGGGPNPGESTVAFQGNFDGPYNGPATNFDLLVSAQDPTGAASGVTATAEALPTPEPASMFLFGSGALGLVAKLRRRKQQA
jgi:hypothetical protein